MNQHVLKVGFEPFAILATGSFAILATGLVGYRVKLVNDIPELQKYPQHGILSSMNDVLVHDSPTLLSCAFIGATAIAIGSVTEPIVGIAAGALAGNTIINLSFQTLSSMYRTVDVSQRLLLKYTTEKLA